MTTLKNLVDETANIKNELITCYTNLKNNLNEKGVSISSSDKLLNLVDKVNNIRTRKYGVSFFKPIYSVPYTRYESSSQYTSRATYTIKTQDEYVDCVRMTSRVRRGYANNDLKYDYYLALFINNVKVVELVSNFRNGSVQEGNEVRLMALKKGDVIELKTKSTSNYGYIEFMLEFGYISEDVAD